MRKPYALAGWTTREFTPDELGEIIASTQPPLIEISKDLADTVSIKELRRVLQRFDAAISFAATTDLTSCGGFAWSEYRDYLDIQIAQARFLGARYFRGFVGVPAAASDRVVCDRIRELEARAAPMQAVFEIHGGWESTPARLSMLVMETGAAVLVDVHNGLACGLGFDGLRASLPAERVAYLHVRNLPPHHIEETSSVDEELRWIEAEPGLPVLWEPKSLPRHRVLEVLHASAAAH